MSTRTMTALLALVAAAVLATAAAPAPARAATKQVPVLAQGAGMGGKPSAAVRRVQRTLRNQGYSLGRPGVDGRFGPLTAAAVRRLQSHYGLAADGIVGAKTRRLVRLIERRTQRPATGRQSKPASRPAAQQQAQPTQPQSNESKASGSNTAGWLFAIALVAAVVAFAAALLQQRRKRGPRDRPVAPAAIAPLTHDLYVEGHSNDRRIADFRGNAFATTLASGSTDEPTR